MWRGLRRALVPTRRTPPMRVIHTLPFQVQWDRTGLWDQLVRAVGGIPGAKIERSKMRAVMPSGGVYQAGGLDNPDAWRGGYADEFIEDECDDAPSGLETIIEPMLADHNGTRLKAGTPKGLGKLKAAYEAAGHKDGHSRYLLRWQDTGIFTAEQIETFRQEMTEEEFNQEWCCSFEAPNSGSYYAKLLQQAEADGRIGSVPYDASLPVWTSWDLGMHDETAIWFCQMRGDEVRWIDYLEGSGEVLGYYVQQIKQRGYQVFEEHILPHDAGVRDIGADIAQSREQTLNSLGMRPTRILPRTNVHERIHALRMILPRSRFDAERCAVGLKALWAYRREWNEHAGVFRPNPVHDWASNGADSAGYMAQGIRPSAPPPKAAPVRGPIRGPSGWMGL